MPKLRNLDLQGRAVIKCNLLLFLVFCLHACTTPARQGVFMLSSGTVPGSASSLVQVIDKRHLSQQQFSRYRTEYHYGNTNFKPDLLEYFQLRFARVMSRNRVERDTLPTVYINKMRLIDRFPATEDRNSRIARAAAVHGALSSLGYSSVYTGAVGGDSSLKDTMSFSIEIEVGGRTYSASSSQDYNIRYFSSPFSTKDYHQIAISVINKAMDEVINQILDSD